MELNGDRLRVAIKQKKNIQNLSIEFFLWFNWTRQKEQQRNTWNLMFILGIYTQSVNGRG
jgi:hypothetical protein